MHEEGEAEPSGGARARRVGRMQPLAGAKLQAAVITGVMMSLQGVRELRGSLYMVWMISAQSPEALGAAAAAQRYTDRCREQGRGHQLGPPGPHRVWGILRALLNRGPQVIGQGTHDRLQQWTDRYSGLSVEHSFALVPHCIVRRAFDKENRKLELHTPDTDLQGLLSAALAAAGARRLLGQAPPGGLEDSLQRTLDSLRRG